ncbi:MAG: hypothetical protein WC683_04110 [bacterium]
MTNAQKHRQRYRSKDGRYREFNPCYRCGKSAGEDYFSGPWTDRNDPLGNQWHDDALCLCESCASYMYSHKDDPAMLWAEANSPEWGKLPQGKGAKA